MGRIREKIKRSDRIYRLFFPERLLKRSLLAGIFSASNFRKNSRIAQGLSKKGYFCRQSSGTDSDRLRFGISSFGRSGCEVMAVCNVLRRMNVSFEIAEVISWFERRGASFAGLFGTYPGAMAAFLEEKGLEAAYFGKDLSEDFDSLAKNADACIFTFWWGGRSLVIHSVMLEKAPDGRGYHAVNLFRNEDFTRVFSIGAMVKQYGLVPVSLITAKKKSL